MFNFFLCELPLILGVAQKWNEQAEDIYKGTPDIEFEEDWSVGLGTILADTQKIKNYLSRFFRNRTTQLKELNAAREPHCGHPWCKPMSQKCCLIFILFMLSKVRRKIFGAERDEITGEWRKLHNAELHALYSSPNIIRNHKSRRLRWAGHVARMEQFRNAYRFLVGKP